MKRIGLFCALLLLAAAASAQRVYFIYVQSDNAAPFYVRMGEKVTSSTAAGYLILSNLRDSSYVLQVGFPGGAAESRFPVTVKGEDLGFVLKQVGGAWNLFDLQSLTLTKALASVGPTDEESRQLLAQADPFTRRLVQASDDLSLLSSGPAAPAVAVENLPPAPIRAVPEPEVVAAEPKPAVKTDTLPARTVAAAPAPADSTAVVAAAPAVTEVTEEPFRRSEVTRRSESSTTEGFGLVFLDKQGSSTDTIRLLIPNPRFVPAKPADSVPVPKSDPVAQVVTDSSKAVAAPAPVAAEAAPIPVASINTDTVVVASPAATSAPDDTILVAAAVKVETTVVPARTPRARAWVIADITCEKAAEQKDFIKLRKNMVSSSDEAEMVSVARKDFGKRCYTVEQTRLLGTLFLTDVARYHFFEAAWGHVSDQRNFAQLELELKDPYMAERLFELSRPKSGQ